MALPAAMFVHAGPYAAWEMWVHLTSGAAVAFGALAALFWVIHQLVRRIGPVALTVARASLAFALATVAVALWVVGSSPSLTLNQATAAAAVAQALQKDSGRSDPPVTTPAWADTVANDLVANYSAYVSGRYMPPLPAGYRLTLVTAPNQALLAPILARGNSAPLPNLAREVTTTLTDLIPASALGAVAAAHNSAVALVEGVAVQPNRHTPVILLAIFTRARG